MTSMFYLDRNEMCDVKKVCSLTFEIELNRFYLWMVVRNIDNFDENALQIGGSWM